MVDFFVQKKIIDLYRKKIIRKSRNNEKILMITFSKRAVLFL